MIFGRSKDLSAVSGSIAQNDTERARSAQFFAKRFCKLALFGLSRIFHRTFNQRVFLTNHIRTLKQETFLFGLMRVRQRAAILIIKSLELPFNLTLTGADQDRLEKFPIPEDDLHKIFVSRQ